MINWGASEITHPEVLKSHVVNSPRRVGYVSNKLNFFKLVGNKCRTVPYTTSKDAVREWLRKGKTVVARTILNGHSAKGVVLLDSTSATLVDAPLYTLYVPKMSEFRVHVVGSRVIDIQRKVLSKEFKDKNRNINWSIRNLANGFIYQRHDVNPPKDVVDQALKAFNATGLDFGAVDVLWNQKKQKAFVLEINTAPGLEGTTVQNYVDGLRYHIHQLMEGM